MAEEKQVRGRDIAAPLDTLEVSGKQYKLAFTNETFGWRRTCTNTAMAGRRTSRKSPWT